MRSTASRAVLGSAALVVSVAAVGQEPVSYGGAIEPLFVAECGDCHAGPRAKKGLDLAAGKGHAALVEKPSAQVPDMLLVKPGDPAGSYLWLKMTHTASEGKGMPRTIFGARKLPPEQLDLIERWIEQGAKP